MSNEDAVKEMKKVERIFRKLSKNGYSVDIKEGVLIMCSDEQQKTAMERINKIHSESKEWGIREGETLYTVDF
tara:strand:+ start:127 stop:345 length:219 start_codon:yes stop_codon:yes gene_type:complete